MPREKYKKIENTNYLKIFSSEDVLIYHHDKLQNITFQYYTTGELKMIEYQNHDSFIINTKKGESISNTSQKEDINTFLKRHYLEINSEDSKKIINFTFSWINECITTEYQNVIVVLKNLINSHNVGVKTKSIQFAANNYLSDCLETISLELDNKTKTDIYRGPVWDDYETHELFTADTFAELAQIAINMITSKTKHNTQ